MEETFNEYLKHLLQELTNVDSMFELYCHLIDRKKDSLNLMNIAPAFFQLTEYSLLSSSILSLAKLFDSYRSYKRSDKNVVRFLGFVESNISIFPTDSVVMKKYGCQIPVTHDLIREHRALIKNKHQLLDKIFIWRDQYYAHSDKKYYLNPSMLSKDANINRLEIRELISLTSDILNSYSIAFNGKNHYYKASNNFDIDKIFDILDEYNKI